MAIFVAIGGALAATTRVKCPHCGKVQVRARGQRHYRCHDCHQAFDVGPGGVKQARAGAPGKRHGR